MSEVQRAGASLQPVGGASDSGPRSYWVCALPFVATLARFRNGFVFDDVFLIESNFIFDLSNLPRALVNRTMIASSLDKAVGRPGMDTYRPLSVASFFWDAAWSDRAPWSYHLTNALLHCAACALLLALLRQLLPELPQRYRTCLAAWFGLSPWLAEAHVWINGRSDPLLAIAFLSSLLFMRRALQEERGALSIASALCLFAGLLCKEIAVVLLPFVALVPAPGDASLRRRLRYAAPLLAALGLYLGLRHYALSGLRSHGDGAQLILALRQLPLVLMDGLVHILAPRPYFLRNMRDDYASLPSWLAPLAWLLCLGFVAFLLRQVRRAYTAVWGTLMALAALAPTAIISTSLWPGFGRYLYVPAIGISVALGFVLERVLRSGSRLTRLAYPSLLSLTVLAGLLLVDAAFGFVNEETLYARAIAERPEQAWTHGFMGLALKREDRCPEAIPYLDRAARLAPAEARYAIRLAQCLLETGSPDAALRVAEAGRARSAGTRAEAGFLLVLARALPSERAREQAALLRRCLAVDPERSDCALGLELIERHLLRSKTEGSEPVR
jgi:hypothetical protein